MYPAKHYIENENSLALHTIIQENPLATLIYTSASHDLHISHIPMHFAQINGYSAACSASKFPRKLIGHVSNAHPLAKALSNASEAQSTTPMNFANITLIFHGPQGYISPLDAPKMQQHEQKVPTWNYANVHLQGHAYAITDEQKKLILMRHSTDYFEQRKSQQENRESDCISTWQLTNQPEKVVSTMLKAITFIEVTIELIEGRFKLSQNKSAELQARLREKLAP